MADHLSEPGLEAAIEAGLRVAHGTPKEQDLEYSGHIEGTKDAICAAIAAYQTALPDDEETVALVAEAMRNDHLAGAWLRPNVARAAARAALRALGGQKDG